MRSGLCTMSLGVDTSKLFAKIALWLADGAGFFIGGSFSLLVAVLVGECDAPPASEDVKSVEEGNMVVLYILLGITLFFVVASLFAPQRPHYFPLSGGPGVIPSPRYVCPYGDQEWFRHSIREPIPRCPNHDVELVYSDKPETKAP